MNTPYLNWLSRLCILSFSVLISELGLSQSEASTYQIQVVEWNSKAPLGDVTIGWMPGDFTEMEILATTDETGNCRFELPEKVSKYSTVYVQKEGYQTVFVSSLHLMPRQHEIELPKAKRIGGIVKDSSGNPVEGVEVKATAYNRPEVSKPNEHIIGHNGNKLAYTDSDGRWYADVAMEATYGIRLRTAHPGSCTAKVLQLPRKNQDEEILSPFFQFEHVTVLEKGILFEGRVLDMSGQPLSEVNITAGHGDSTQSFDETFQTTSSIDGKFKVRFLRSDHRVLLFKKDGYQMSLNHLSDAESGVFETSLEKGHDIRIHVIDPEGKPVVGAYVRPNTMETWGISLAGNTDIEGNWHSNTAPDTSITFMITKDGFQQAIVVRNQGKTNPIEIQLKPQPRIEILVKDADSKEPLSQFTVTEGSLWGGLLSPLWDKNQKHEGQGGVAQFQLDSHSSNGEKVFLIEANGYLPQQSEKYRTIEENLSLVFELEKAEMIRGTVQDPSGKAPRMAVIYAMNEHELLGIYQSGYAGFSDAAKRENKSHTFTKPGGRFEIMPGLNTEYLVIASENGMSVVSDFDPTKLLNVELQPYSTVVGQVKSPGEHTISLQYPTSRRPGIPPLAVRLKTITDSDGSYRFERVPFGPYELGRAIANDNRMYFRDFIASDAEFSLEPGEVKSVSIGGIGSAIRGKAVLANGLTSDIDWTMGRYEMSLAPPISEMPMRSKYASDEAFQNALEKVKGELMAFAATEEGMRFFQNRKEYPIRMHPDGSFESLEVPPGRYHIDLRPEAYESTGQGSRSTSIGMGGKMITIPEGHNKEPFDIGDVEVELLGRLAAGKKAPDFELKDADGNRVRLSDYRGKYVFLDFWSTTCGPCIAELTNLREAYDAFKDHPDFVMIALSLDEDWEAIERFKRKQSMPWKHVRVGPFRTSQVLEHYGVYGIPDNFLISPEGVVLRKSMRGQAVYSALLDFLPKGN